ncbi:helix-turn-helix domain-containing protein [Emticicia oligotrophica]|uniref:winged helix-turn-helix transcriptional regulator n=1 Tax=Emticicia oligotrophica TaxID=312279 RepID=UPI00273B896E|nr:winged helix-turn-helix transcriptional regulator [Emticicia oligotrophica]
MPKYLEENGFVRRKVEIGVSMLVEYELLSYACTLLDILSALVLWGEMHREKGIREYEELV